MNYFDSLLLFNVLKAKPPLNDTQILINEYYYYFFLLLLFLFGIFLFASKINELYKFFFFVARKEEHQPKNLHTYKKYEVFCEWPFMRCTVAFVDNIYELIIVKLPMFLIQCNDILL